MPEENRHDLMKRIIKTYLATTRETLNMAEKAIDENDITMAQFWVDGLEQITKIVNRSLHL